jgi:serine/threonine-protein kinase
VAAAHQVGVIHRDLKPDNIFLCEAQDGSAREAKVLDFGVASIASAGPGESTLTRAGTVLGSPAYMSPEQLQNAHDVDVRTDVYAFGIILYEVLAGFRPFRGDTPAALIVAIERLVPKPLSQAREGLPAEIEQVVLRAFAREPARRYPDMASLIGALQPFSSAGK